MKKKHCFLILLFTLPVGDDFQHENGSLLDLLTLPPLVLPEAQIPNESASVPCAVGYSQPMVNASVSISEQATVMQMPEHIDPVPWKPSFGGKCNMSTWQSSLLFNSVISNSKFYKTNCL